LTKPKLAVFKFASCDGCQLSLLDCEDELLLVAEAVTIANFPEASRAVQEGPYDITLVDGSITTPHDAKRIHEIREQSNVLVTIGACATAGGIQALRNYRDVDDFVSAVYAQPAYIDTLQKSTPISEHVKVDYELRGCPVNKYQLLEVISALLNRRRPAIASHSVCMECKRRGVVCLTVAKGTACLGPVTHAGCGALCPRYDRGCFGCFGPSDSPRVEALAEVLEGTGATHDEIHRLYAGFNVSTAAFRDGQLITLRRRAEAEGAKKAQRNERDRG